MKDVKRIMLLFVMAMSLFLFKGTDAKAADINNISVNVPTRVDIVFNEDGTTSVSDWFLDNQSIVPVEINGVIISEFNDWQVVQKKQEILVNSKQLSLMMGETELLAGSNPFYHEVAEYERYDFGLNVKRGAWTQNVTSEKALEIELKYEMGTKEFTLTLDGNGGECDYVVYVENGSEVSLPEPTRDGYEFVGWQDERGNQYKGIFIMPIGDTSLKAVWKEMTAYALYIAEDQSLRFVRSAEPIVAGSHYDGKTVTDVYTGFETTTYTSAAQVPWYDKDYYNTRIVTKVITEDVIRPVNTSYWFQWMYDCESFDLQKLDTSKVENMAYMFAWAGFSATNFELKGVENFDVSKVKNMSYTFGYTGRDAGKVVMDLSKWDVSSVTNMSYMFAGAGYFSTTFSLGDLSGWNVSNVTNMSSMFRQTGYSAAWSVNCSNWNVNKVTSYRSFNLEVDSKVIAPSWKN